jgi:hypothetical protein
MKVKIGNTLYDPSEQPIAIIFADDKDRKTFATQVKNMPDKPGARAYVAAPDHYDQDDIKHFVREHLKGEE